MEKKEQKPYDFQVGDTIKVTSKIRDKDKERQTNFQGVVIAEKGKGISRTFTVRKIGKSNIGVERIFPYFSPNIVKVEIIQHGKPRRSKLYYLRDRKGKAATYVRSVKR